MDLRYACPYFSLKGVMATDQPQTDERIKKAAEFLGVSGMELKREIQEALIRQVANELAAESLKQWKADQGGQR
jgi:hypothetical protein